MTPPEDQKRSWTARLIIWYRISICPVLDIYKYPILLALWVSVFIIGYLGFSEVNPDGSVPNIVVLTAQLFIMPAGNLQVSSSLLLNIARAGATVLIYLSILAFMAHAFYYQLKLLWLRLFVRHHIVVCGLGNVGSIVVHNMLSTRAEPIVVIEADPSHKEVEWCKRHGITVVHGNATECRILELARVQLAHAVYIATGSDDVNTKVVARIHEIHPAGEGLLHCYVHIVDPNFASLLRGPQLGASGVNAISLEFFNIYQIANFCVLECIPDLIPLIPEPPQRNILVIGLGRMGEGLITEIAKRWMQTYKKHPEKKIRVVAIDRNADRKKKILEIRFPRLAEYCEIVPYSLDLNSPEFLLAQYLEDPHGERGPDAVFICLSDESLNFSTGLFLHQKINDPSVPIIIRTLHSTGLTYFFNQICRKYTEDYRNIHAFPLVSCSCCMETLVGTNELLARTIHRHYRLMRFRDGTATEGDPAMQPWRTLDPEYKASSRSQASRIRHALQPIGCHFTARTDWDEPLIVFSASEIETMAEMEHNRWWEQKASRGWTAGPRDLEKKTSPYLVPYDQLDETIKEYDRRFVRLYPEILAMVDLSIKRNPGTLPDGSGSEIVSWHCESS